MTTETNTTDTKPTDFELIVRALAFCPDDHIPLQALGRITASRYDLLESCLKMLKLTEGSIYWKGDTKTVLEFMESAVEKATKGA